MGPTSFAEAAAHTQAVLEAGADFARPVSRGDANKKNQADNKTEALLQSLQPPSQSEPRKAEEAAPDRVVKLELAQLGSSAIFGGPITSPCTITITTHNAVTYSLPKHKLWALGNHNLWEALKKAAWPTLRWLTERSEQLQARLKSALGCWAG